MEAKYHWLQEYNKANVLTTEKTRGMVNPADLMTKHLNGATMRDMCGLRLARLVRDGPGADSAEVGSRQRLRSAL